MAKKNFYVVWNGRNPGIYDNWPECEKQVKGYSRARYKGYHTREEAEAAYQNPPRENTKPSPPNKNRHSRPLNKAKFPKTLPRQ